MFDPSEVDLDTTTQEILLHASNHDITALKPFLRVPGAASVQDPETGYTPLHAAIAACEGTIEESKDATTASAGSEVAGDADLQAAEQTVRELLLAGAIWNDLDVDNETPGCLAWRLGQRVLYELIVDAGVRAEMLMNLMGGYEELESEDEEEEGEEDMVDGKDAETQQQEITAEQLASIEKQINDSLAEHMPATNPKKDVNSADYLASDLVQTDTALLDSENNGVMMEWETPIMQLTRDLITPDSSLRVLNIGFGMGIVDALFAETKPSVHHIIEAHPAVLKTLQSDSLCAFGPSWQASTSADNQILRGKWQAIVPQLLQQDQQYDAIYFDTFGESYSQLKLFFSEYVVGLLAPEGKFSFFNGLGADRRVCYDVYCKVVELDLCAAGFDVEWRDIEVKELGAEGEGEWKGIRRRYWTLDTYRLPLVTHMG